mgnify:CR=1 FL=1
MNRNKKDNEILYDFLSANPDNLQPRLLITREIGSPVSWKKSLRALGWTGGLVERVTVRQSDASDATADIVRQQLSLDVGLLAPAWTAIDAAGSAEQTLARARSALRL